MTVPDDVPYNGMLVITDWAAVDDPHQVHSRKAAPTAHTAQAPVGGESELEAEHIRHYRAQLEQLHTLRAQETTRADLEGLQRAVQLTDLERDLVHAALKSLPAAGADDVAEEEVRAEYEMAERLVHDLGWRCRQRQQQRDLERYREDQCRRRQRMVVLFIIVYAAVTGFIKLVFDEFDWPWLLLLMPVILAAAVCDPLLRRWERAHPVPEPTPAQLEQFLDRERRGMTLPKLGHH
jgi:hypothetical protein